jgi:polysaccharide deacetylase family protein (PEP-CTERM system associated)
MQNALSVDVEDYFQVSAFAAVVDSEEWSGFEARVVQSTHRILDILAEYRLHATFFVVGWVAEQHPHLVQRIHAQGHEIASHGHAHQLISRQSPEQFKQDVEQSLHALEDITGSKILGYRAPSYSITPETVWAFDILHELGFKYDSSVFPIHHDLGGFPGAPRHPYQIREGFWEFPLATWRIGRWGVPILGGGYLRLYPYRLTRWFTRKVNEEGIPAVVYVHPWEFDIDQPRIERVSFLSRFRHYQNLDKTEGRLRALCQDFDLAPIREALQNWLSHAPNM